MIKSRPRSAPLAKAGPKPSAPAGIKAFFLRPAVILAAAMAVAALFYPRGFNQALAESGDFIAPKIMVLPSRANQPARIGQGDSFLIEVRDEAHLISSIRVAWQDLTIPLLPEPDRDLWLGLGAVARDQKIDPQKGKTDIFFDLHLETTLGTRLHLGASLAAVATDYERGSLTVDPKLLNVPPEFRQRVAEDRAAFAALWPEARLFRSWTVPFNCPLPDCGPNTVSSTFGKLRTYNQSRTIPHMGVDLAAEQGDEIKAAAGGKVVLTRDCYMTGNSVVIDHGGGLFTSYFHMSGYKVEVENEVKAGDVIGLVGSTGRSTGPHLHWGCRAHDTDFSCLSLLSLSLTQAPAPAAPEPPPGAAEQSGASVDKKP